MQGGASGGGEGGGGALDWAQPPSIGAGIFGGTGSGGDGGGGGGLGDMAVLPKRHARFMERFKAAKDSRALGGGGTAGVTSFGALLPDAVGRAD